MRVFSNLQLNIMLESLFVSSRHRNGFHFTSLQVCDYIESDAPQSHVVSWYLCSPSRLPITICTSTLSSRQSVQQWRQVPERLAKYYRIKIVYNEHEYINLFTDIMLNHLQQQQQTTYCFNFLPRRSPPVFYTCCDVPQHRHRTWLIF